MHIVSRAVSVLAIAVCVLGVSGCGSSVVDTGRSSARPPIATGQETVAAPAHSPAAGAGVVYGNTSGTWGNLEHVPASQVLARPRVDQPAVYHEVVAGDTLPTVAAKYGVTPEQIRRSNGFDAKSTLQPGQLLFIPR